MNALGWRPLPWQESLWLDLTAQALQNRLPHAVLMSGPAGIGKRLFARALAGFLLCEQRSGYACGQCRSCQQFAAGTHPNAAWLGTNGHLGLSPDPAATPENGIVHWEPDKESKRRDIAMAAVQSLIARLAQTSHYGQARVILIDPADRLNESSVNALLKIVEEPPPGTHLWFLSERPGMLRPTLRSRCQRLRFTMPDREAAIAWLEQCDVPEAAAALDAARGAPLRALGMAGDDTFALQREWNELWLSLARRRLDPVTAAAQIGRESADEHVLWAWGWLNDHFRERVSSGLSGDASRAWERMLGEMGDVRRRLNGNAQPQLLLEALFVQWMRLGPTALGTAG